MIDKIDEMNKYFEIVESYKKVEKESEKEELKNVIINDYFNKFDIKKVAGTYNEKQAANKIIRKAFYNMIPIQIKTDAFCVSWVRGSYPYDFTNYRVCKQVYCTVYETGIRIGGDRTWNELSKMANEGLIIISDYNLEVTKIEPDRKHHVIFSDTPSTSNFATSRNGLVDAASKNQVLFDTMIDFYEESFKNQIKNAENEQTQGM